MVKTSDDITPRAISDIVSLVSRAKRVVITCHVSPDGDAIGSSLALRGVLMAQGKYARVVTPDLPPRSLSFLPGAESIVVASCAPEMAASQFSQADLIVCLDFNDPTRIDRLAPCLEKTKARKVLIDHHLFPVDFADVTVSLPSRSSTCLLLHEVMLKAGWSEFINAEAATCLMAGMMTDTGGLTYNSNSPGLYLAMADLLSRGADHDAIYKRIFDTASESRLRLCSYALYRKMLLMKEFNLSIITLTKQELDEFGYQRGDTESLVNKPLAMEDTLWSVFMRQDSDNFVKVSMRSKGDFPVNEVCEALYGGGGHKNAAGGEFYGSLDDAVNALVEALPRFRHYLPNHNNDK